MRTHIKQRSALLALYEAQIKESIKPNPANPNDFFQYMKQNIVGFT